MQETATTMVGMILGMMFTHVTDGHVAYSWLLFVLLTLLHIYANVKAMRCLVLHSLNPSRLELLLDTFLSKVWCMSACIVIILSCACIAVAHTPSKIK